MRPTALPATRPFPYRSAGAALLAAFLLAGAVAAAEPSAQPTAKAALQATPGKTVILDAPAPRVWRGHPISLSLKDADLEEVLRSFARLARVNLVLDPRVEGKVTVELHDVPWDQALYVILKAHGLAADIDGRIWGVYPREVLLERLRQ